MVTLTLSIWSLLAILMFTGMCHLTQPWLNCTVRWMTQTWCSMWHLPRTLQAIHWTMSLLGELMTLCLAPSLSPLFSLTIKLWSLRCACLSLTQIHYCQLRRINHTQLWCNLQQLSVVMHPAVSLTALVEQYNTDLSELLERHAPLKSWFLTLRPYSPWYDADLLAAKQKRCRSELQWRRSWLTVHRQMYIEQWQAVARLLSTQKTQYYSNQVKENTCDPKIISGLVDKLLQKKTETSLPQHSSLDDLVEDFSSFFINKIQALRQQPSSCLQDSTVTVPEPVSCRATNAPPLSCFRHVDDSEVLRVVSVLSPKSCSLDLLPTSILKANIDVLLPALTRIINHLITSGCFPSAFNRAHVIPLLKNSLLDQDAMKNYRPVSNLVFVSKVVERDAWPPSLKHTCWNTPCWSLHSRTTGGIHSTESALLWVCSDALQATDGKKCVMLVLLDLSAAFETIDHEILLLHLEIDTVFVVLLWPGSDPT